MPVDQLAIDRKRQQLDRDTYLRRQEEQRPKHGQQSFTIVGIGIASWFLLLMCLALPEWRASDYGVLGYMHRRSWGLFTVLGKKSMMHHQMFEESCRYMRDVTFNGMCMTPICHFYRIKCTTYLNLMMFNYFCGFGWAVCLVLHTLAIIWTVRLSPRMIRWADYCWGFQLMAHLTLFSVWNIGTGICYAELDTESYYPEPDNSFCVYFEALVIMAVATNWMMGFQLWCAWPEASTEESSEDDDWDTGWMAPPPGKGKWGKKGGGWGGGYDKGGPPQGGYDKGGGWGKGPPPGKGGWGK